MCYTSEHRHTHTHVFIESLEIVLRYKTTTKNCGYNLGCSF